MNGSTVVRLRLSPFAIVSLILLLSACGPVPQPFRDSPKATTDNPLIDVPGAMGVTIVPPQGMPPKEASALADAVVRRLLAMEVPAEKVAGKGGLGFTLSGRAIVQGPGTYTLQWTLRSRRDANRSDFSTTVHTPPGDDVATEIAEQVTKGLGLVSLVDESAAQRFPPKGLPTVSVKAIENAPSDAGEALRLAVLQALLDAGARRDDVNPDVVLQGHMDVADYDTTSDRVTIVWRAVTRAGRDLGTAQVENTIPVAVVQGPWGPTAFAVAAALQRDLVRLVSQASP
jgi:hypothetical protein